MHVKLRRLWIQMTADRKRFALLCAMLALGMLLWARILIVRNVPRTVVAEEETEQVASAESRSKEDSSESALSSTSGAVRKEDVVVVAMDTSLERDPFVISPKFFPKPAVEQEFGKDRDKSGSQAVEDSQSTSDQWLASLRDRVQRFRLEAILSNPPLASINGRTYRLGDEIAADPQDTIRFTLTEVRERSVILEYEEQSFELKLPNFPQP